MAQKGKAIMAKIREDFFLLTNAKYGRGIAIDFYGDEVSLVSASKNESGDIWAEWCYPQRRMDGKNVPAEKGIPFRLTLGVRGDAIRKLEELLTMLERGKPADEDPPSPYGTPQPQEFGTSPSGADKDDGDLPF